MTKLAGQTPMPDGRALLGHGVKPYTGHVILLVDQLKNVTAESEQVHGQVSDRRRMIAPRRDD
ncbi:hypothetical protein [Actinomadura oligospora]|uniref:hypothetical protein n=1 Tax=Actinomadura oligospora TaxID=111804 RepID=UPI001474427D|nr:hypothetical protein [Actinomadura oligospora]